MVPAMTSFDIFFFRMYYRHRPIVAINKKPNTSTKGFTSSHRERA